MYRSDEWGLTGLGAKIYSLLAIHKCLLLKQAYAVMFAGGVKIWRTIENTSDVQNLQNDIDRQSTWSQGALMRFITDKCAVLRL